MAKNGVWGGWEHLVTKCGTKGFTSVRKKTEFLDISSKTIDMSQFFSNWSEALVVAYFFTQWPGLGAAEGWNITCSNKLG